MQRGLWVFSGVLQIIIYSFSYVQGASCPENVQNNFETIEWTCTGENHEFQVQSIFDSETLTLKEKNYFNVSSRPYRREVHTSKYGLLGVYELEYLNLNSESDLSLKEIKVSNFEGDPLAHHSTEVLESEIEETINPISLTEPKVLIIDSGSNYLHPWVHGKHFVNTGEAIDGLDNDGDGLVDNKTTFYGQQGAGGSIDYSFNHNQPIQLSSAGALFTHGGFVASVALKDINHLSYLSAGGDIHSAVYLYKLLEQINRYDIRFTNMSFGFGDRQGVSIVEPDSIEAVEGIVRATMGKTLHVVAAGNANRNFSKTSYSEYPACLNLPNVITVGALDTHALNEDNFESYEKASFSNIGQRCVDIMAPGVNVMGAGLGSSLIEASGTSVSSPYVLNVLLKMHKENPDLTPAAYKKILLETAYVPVTKEFDVSSKGIVFSKRALYATQNTLHMSVDEAIKESMNQVVPHASFLMVGH